MSARSVGAPRVLDVTRLLGRVWRRYPATGIDRVGLAYVQRYAHEAHALVRIGPWWTVLSPSDSAVLFSTLARWQAPSVWQFLRAMLRASIRRDTTPAWLFNVVHSGTESSSYSTRAIARGFTPCYLLHDLIPLTHPEHCRAGEGRRHAARLRTMVHSGALLITNSRHTATQLQDYASRQQWSLPPVLTAPLGLTQLPIPGARPSERPYFLMLATIESRKNHALLLDVWLRLIEQHGAAAPTLVVIGRRGWSADGVLARLDHCPILKPHLRVVHDCDDVMLASWMAHAEALLYPSLVEGWGLPIAEALSLGVSVLASDLPVFREVAGHVPDYLSPTDPQAWQAMVEDYMGSDSNRTKQALRLATWRASTWEDHFRTVDGALGHGRLSESSAHRAEGLADAA